MGKQIDHLRAVFVEHGNRPFLVSTDGKLEITYAQALERALRLAVWLQRQGVAPGSRVNFVSSNSIELALLYFATWHIGAQVVPVNPLLSKVHLAEIIEDTGGECVVADCETAAELPQSVVDSRQVIVFERHEDGRGRSLSGVMSDASLDAEVPQAFGSHDDDQTPFLRIYTSGTTQKPKGIDISYAGLVGNERLFCQTLGITHENRFYNVLPMSYLGGVHNLLLLPASVGASVVIGEPLGGANLYGFWETVRDRAINTPWFTSAMLSMLMALRDENEKNWLTKQIRIALVGMAPLSPQIKSEFEQRYGFMLYENFAMSETTFLTSNRPDLPYREGSSGAVLDGVTIDIVDMQDNPVAAGGEGQVVAHTPYMMLGYVNAPAEDLANVIPGGIYTGDLGYVDQGELFITGRVKDLIIRGGLNISPAQVEAVVAGVDGIAEVAVVGVPHSVYGEEVAAAVILNDDCDKTEKDLLHELDGRIAHFQKPKRILIVDELPLGLTMKVDKKEIRKLFD